MDQKPIKKQRKPRTKTVLSSKNQMRNLSQFKELSDDEFDEMFAKRLFGIEKAQIFEQRIEKKLADFAEDYDVSDMKINDKYLLRALAQAVVSLEDYENFVFNIRAEGIGTDNIFLIEKIQKVMTDLRRDVSTMQDDLKITRKIRKGDSETSVINYIETLKEKAKKFYESRMMIVTCPKCNKWIFSGWFLFPHEKQNKIILQCSGDMGDGTKCGEMIRLTSVELLEKRGYSSPETFPESMI